MDSEPHQLTFWNRIFGCSAEFGVGLWLIGCCTAKGPPGETLLPVDDDYCHSMASLPFMSVLPTRKFVSVKTENYDWYLERSLFSVCTFSLEESFGIC